MSEFNIGDRVRSITLGKAGVVEDKLFSNKADGFVYIVKFDDSTHPFYKPLPGGELVSVEEPTYRFEVYRADNVMVAVMYEDGCESEREIGRFHGHIIHEGAIGVAQAASYAMKKLYTSMNGGSMLVYGGDEVDV